VRDRDDLTERLQVALGGRSASRVRREGRILGRHGFDGAHGESGLEVDRLLGPERAVVVENCDSSPGCDVVLPRGIGDGLNEREEACLDRALVPRRQRIGRSLAAGNGHCEQAGGASEHEPTRGAEGHMHLNFLKFFRYR
jgi:hypothetical protein